MTKSEIVAAIAEQYGLHPKEVHITITKFLNLIVDELEETGGPVKIHGFGRFEVQNMTREWKNPRSGVASHTSTRKRISFTPAEAFRERLNGQS